MFSIQDVFQLLCDVSELLKDVSKDTALMDTPGTSLGGTGRELRYQPPSSIEEYVLLHAIKNDASRFALKKAFTMSAGYQEQDMAFACWFKI